MANLILIENDSVKVIDLEEKEKWSLGRESQTNRPDIPLHLKTVSRAHGRFEKEDEFWVYIDGCGKNGTFLNQKKIKKQSAQMLDHGDLFVFASGENMVINSSTVTGVYCEKEYGSEWKSEAYDMDGAYMLCDGAEKKAVTKPRPGMIAELKHGMAIFMEQKVFQSKEMQITRMQEEEANA